MDKGRGICRSFYTMWSVWPWWRKMGLIVNTKFIIIILLSTVSINTIFLSGRCYSRENDKELVVAVLENWPPHYYLDSATGRPAGFAIEAFEEVAKNCDLQFRYEFFTSWPTIFAAQKKGQVDLVLNMGITEERRNQFDFTVPLETFEIHIFIRETTQHIKGIEDLQGKSVAVVRKNKGLYLMEGKGGSNLKVLDSIEKAFLLLISGNVDALIYPEPIVLLLARQAGLEDRIKTAGKPLHEVKRGIAVRKGQAELLKTINTAVEEFVVSNRYKEISDCP